MGSTRPLSARPHSTWHNALPQHMDNSSGHGQWRHIPHDSDNRHWTGRNVRRGGRPAGHIWPDRSMPPPEAECVGGSVLGKKKRRPREGEGVCEDTAQKRAGCMHYLLHREGRRPCTISYAQKRPERWIISWGMTAALPRRLLRENRVHVRTRPAKTRTLRRGRAAVRTGLPGSATGNWSLGVSVLLLGYTRERGAQEHAYTQWKARAHWRTPSLLSCEGQVLWYTSCSKEGSGEPILPDGAR